MKREKDTLRQKQKEVDTMMNRHIKEKQRINQVSNIANKYSKKDAKNIANILQKTKSSHQREAENQTVVKYCLWEIIAGTKYCWWEIISKRRIKEKQRCDEKSLFLRNDDGSQ